MGENAKPNTTVFAAFDSRTRVILEWAEYLLYFLCDHDAQCILQKAEVNGTLDLNGVDSDPSIELLVETELSLIAHESPNKRIKNELDCFETIYKCTKTQGEDLHRYLTRFKAFVAHFTVTSSLMNEYSSRHFGMLLVRNLDAIASNP